MKNLKFWIPFWIVGLFMGWNHEEIAAVYPSLDTNTLVTAYASASVILLFGIAILARKNRIKESHEKAQS